MNVRDAMFHARTGPTTPGAVDSPSAAGLKGDGLVKTGAG
ncbi:hypothetical protein ACS15_4172 [Ralstonia insidiosa]|uniref:Uncharacterized protein n=1 Tax=Ralstonia insidiosa TaxID=190721 RepID=A0AAC9FTZ9_9RALS|nr:hypothetical protein ACS15_4172 [Ralstonia insidiosa]